MNLTEHGPLMGRFAIGAGNLGLPMIVQFTGKVRRGKAEAIGVWGVTARGHYKHVPLLWPGAAWLTDADVVDLNCSVGKRPDGAVVGYVERGVWRTATGADADRIWRERGGS